MSDLESSRPPSPEPSAHSFDDGHLHDHRYQRSLPLPLNRRDSRINVDAASAVSLHQIPSTDDPAGAARVRSRTQSVGVNGRPGVKNGASAANTGILLNKQNSRRGLVVSQTSGDPRPGPRFTQKRVRRTSRSSVDSDGCNSLMHSRSSQETEEDVCFPMVPEHVRIKGIDFDEMEEFITETRTEDIRLAQQQEIINNGGCVSAHSVPESVPCVDGKLRPTTSNQPRESILHKYSSAAAKYTPLWVRSAEKEPGVESVTSEKKDSEDSSSANVKFNNTIRFPSELEDIPDRFSFFCSESQETVHAPDFPTLLEPGETARNLFRNGESTWWLDVVCPTDAEMRMLTKAFGIHPLTAEDIRMQETREKVELFKNYYFVCFHSFETDKESEEFLEPINVYMVVFREGILSFHFSPISHPANVRRRVRQLRDYVDVSADWLCYALIDDITDGFAPVITSIEYEADAIEESVFARELDFSTMLLRIGDARRRVMTLMRLLTNKADVIKMFAKRCQDEMSSAAPHVTPSPPLHPDINMTLGAGGVGVQLGNPVNRAQPRGDIALYLGDIQDHIVTMYQNLAAYEKIFSRSHSNYLAQLQALSLNSNNRINDMLSKVTLIGTILVPLNVVTGLFGMNVTVPGEAQGNLRWFFGILGVIFFIVIVALSVARLWLARNEVLYVENPSQGNKSLFSFRSKRAGARSMRSLPSRRFNRYE